MSRLRLAHVKPGNVTSATDINNFINDFTIASGEVKGTNLRKEAISTTQLATGGSLISYDGYLSDADGTPHDINSIALTTIDTGIAADISGIGTTINEGDVIRLRASVLTGIPTVGAPTLDTFYFSFLATNTTGLSNINLGPAFRYSMQGHKESTINPSSTITWNTHVIVWDEIWDTTSFSLNRIRLQAAVQNASNTIPIIRWNLLVQIDKA